MRPMSGEGKPPLTKRTIHQNEGAGARAAREWTRRVVSNRTYSDAECTIAATAVREIDAALEALAAMCPPRAPITPAALREAAQWTLIRTPPFDWGHRWRHSGEHPTPLNLVGAVGRNAALLGGSGLISARAMLDEMLRVTRDGDEPRPPAPQSPGATAAYPFPVASDAKAAWRRSDPRIAAWRTHFEWWLTELRGVERLIAAGEGMLPRGRLAMRREGARACRRGDPGDTVHKSQPGSLGQMAVPGDRVVSR